GRPRRRRPFGHRYLSMALMRLPRSERRDDERDETEDEDRKFQAHRGTSLAGRGRTFFPQIWADRGQTFASRSVPDQPKSVEKRYDPLCAAARVTAVRALVAGAGAHHDRAARRAGRRVFLILNRRERGLRARRSWRR